jgi:hypothetical protein
MKNITDNNLIFKNITKKKDGLYANFKAMGVKGGTRFSASISVDLSATDINPSDPLEKIIEESAKHAVREFKKSDLRFEGVASL